MPKKTRLSRISGNAGGGTLEVALQADGGLLIKGDPLLRQIVIGMACEKRRSTDPSDFHGGLIAIGKRYNGRTAADRADVHIRIGAGDDDGIRSFIAGNVEAIGHGCRNSLCRSNLRSAFTRGRGFKSAMTPIIIHPTLMLLLALNPAAGNLTVNGAGKGFDRLFHTGVGVAVKGTITQETLDMTVELLRSVS